MVDEVQLTAALQHLVINKKAAFVWTRVAFFYGLLIFTIFDQSAKHHAAQIL